jgi:hypothetical protein
LLNRKKRISLHQKNQKTRPICCGAKGITEIYFKLSGLSKKKIILLRKVKNADFFRDDKGCGKIKFWPDLKFS